MWSNRTVLVLVAVASMGCSSESEKHFVKVKGRPERLTQFRKGDMLSVTQYAAALRLALRKHEAVRDVRVVGADDALIKIEATRAHCLHLRSAFAPGEPTDVVDGATVKCIDEDGDLTWEISRLEVRGFGN